MLEITQEILEEIDPLLDAGDTASAGRLLVVLVQWMKLRWQITLETVGAVS